MMELTTCAFILTLISLVTATPYGYGVKGGAGASSRAESSAIAGPFGNQGSISVPVGGAFSGSFSKSSSSSSSSSSASSSSSSSSFSYNGGGSFSSPDTNGYAGCTSGICQNTGHQGSIGGTADFNSYNIANSGAIAGSGGATGLNCQGSQCNDNSGKCSSGQCQPTAASNTGYDSGSKCSSGQCSPTSQSKYSASQYDDSDDIHFVPHSSKAVHDSKNHAFNGKTTDYNAGSDCQHGNCGPPAISTQPKFAHGSPNSYPANSYSGVAPGYNLPATHLDIPNSNSGCTSGACHQSQNNSPTSYNVPIHGSSSGCNTPGCSTVFSSPGTSPQIQYENKVDESSRKVLPIYTGGFGGPAGMLKPNHFNIPISTTSRPVHFTNPTHNTPSIAVQGCTTPNCIGSPSITGSGTSTTAESGSYSGSVTASNDKSKYTGGFGGPPGMLKPNEFNIAIPTTSRPVHFTNPTYNTPSIAVPGCSTPNCIDSPSTAVSGASTTAESGSYTGSVTAFNDKTKYTGGFGGPPGMLKPNEFNIPISTTSRPVHFTNPTYNTPSIAVPGCSTPNCMDSPSIAVSGASTTVQSGSYSGSVTTSNDKTKYTEGFGGPPGMLKPNEFNIPISTTSKPVHFTNPTYSSPSIAVPGCKTPNCIDSPSITVSGASTTAESGSHSGSVTASNDIPKYTSDFGGPHGMLKPDEFDIKVPVHSSFPTHNKHSPISADCPTPNCKGYTPKPILQLSSIHPVYSGGFGGPPRDLHPNVINVHYSTPNTPTFSADDTNPQASFGVPKPITTPNPSFPGSANNYRPIGVTYPSAPAVAPITTSYTTVQPIQSTFISPPECNTKNCATNPSGVHVVTGPSGSYGNSEGCKGAHCTSYPGNTVNVNAPTGNYGNAGDCKTGNCGGLTASGSNDKSEADANTSSGLYGHSTECKTGNCGATYPNNSLKPSIPQYPGVSGEPSDKTVPSGSGFIECKTSNCATSLTANSGANAQSGLNHKSKDQLPVYTGGFGGPPGLLKPNDYSKPDVTALSNKPVSGLSIPLTCSSGNCNPKEVPLSSTHSSGLSGAHAAAASSANAVVYTGGFGGPPGFLTPYDNGKVDLAKVIDTHKQGTHYSGGNTLNIAIPTGTQLTTGSLGGSVVGTTALSGSIANANSGSFGYNSQSNGVKGSSSCGGGCSGGSPSGLQNSGSYAAAGARSLSSSSAHGLGGSYASSSASAQSSAGAYTKGGYGKR